VASAEVAKSGRSDRPEERRQFHRVHLDAPIPGRMNDVPVQMVDLSLNGARIISEARFGPGTEHELNFKSNDQDVILGVSVVRCTLFSFAKAPGEKSTYQSGLRIRETIGDSDRLMRELIASYVIRALEEQKANARGLPPLGPYAYLEGKGDRFRRCELIEGKWRRSETTRSDQPPNGFTVSADIRPYYVDLLCETYQMLDEEGKHLTQTLAQLSVNKAEGVPTRRYLP
jgi:hypothetical protein